MTAFLSSNGIDSSQLELQGIKVTDVLANPFQRVERAGSQFIIQHTVEHLLRD